MKKSFHHILLLALVFLLSWNAVRPVVAQEENSVSVYDLIALINNQRVGYGLPALQANSILMSTAQQTADTMAANSMGWHIGNVSGRVMAAGYGGGATAWATENFAIGPMTLDEIAWIWSDESHQIPVVKPNYTDIGAGIAISPSGSVYYVVQAAYTGGGSAASPTRAVGSGTAEPTSNATEAMAQFIAPVTIATPGADGAIHHEVLYGQSLWSIAIAYNTKIVDILRTNGLSPESQIVYAGQELIIPSPTPSSGTASTSLTGTLTVPVSTDAGSPESLQPEKTLQPTTNGPHAANTVQVNLRYAPTSKTTLNAATPQPNPLITATPASSADRSGKNNIVPILLGVTFILGIGLVIFGLLFKHRQL